MLVSKATATPLRIGVYLRLIAVRRMEKATADPSTLSQEAIVENLDPVEAARLSKVRNIGIAVRRPTRVNEKAIVCVEPS